ncbi:hypothetical protein HYC85_011591 [Camellia sinensis]|uniref:Uncharacterized protein n=1 Tax=Camellia sinensis TaxID=4442 RepID=A0A7J7HCL8_CAMSI|nr:hypothetical protein HYC85_011591 [Camellia sinensis]
MASTNLQQKEKALVVALPPGVTPTIKSAYLSKIFNPLFTLGLLSLIFYPFISDSDIFGDNLGLAEITSASQPGHVAPRLTRRRHLATCWALHEKEKRSKGGLTRLQFFLMVFISTFSYYLIPSYFFPSISSLSFVCWIWKDSITAQQLGSGLHGMGLGSFGFDWSTIAGFLGSPLAYPAFAIVNVMVGFFLTVYVMIPVAYWSNAYEAKRFPSAKTFDFTGHTYNITRVLNQETFDLHEAAYNGYSKLYLSVFFAFTYGLSFATLAAAISHVVLFHGKTIMRMWKGTAVALQKLMGDVHTRIMKRNYEEVPSWWFYTILAVTLALSLITCEGFGRQLQLPWWGILLACAMALFFTLPIGIITATTNQQPGLNVITELVIGYLYPGKPLANVAFKTYVFYNASIIWGVVGPLRMFTKQGIYPEINWFFIVGFLAKVPVWILSRKFPEKKWIQLINMPIIFGATMSMPPARAVNCITWATVGLFFNVYIYRKYKGWWARHTYILSAALDAGVAFMGVILYFALQSKDILGPSWWGLEMDDHCPLAKCPTAPGIQVKGCPVL